MPTGPDRTVPTGPSGFDFIPLDRFRQIPEGPASPGSGPISTGSGRFRPDADPIPTDADRSRPLSSPGFFRTPRRRPPREAGRCGQAAQLGKGKATGSREKKWKRRPKDGVPSSSIGQASGESRGSHEDRKAGRTGSEKPDRLPRWRLPETGAASKVSPKPAHREAAASRRRRLRAGGSGPAPCARTALTTGAAPNRGSLPEEASPRNRTGSPHGNRFRNERASPGREPGQPLKTAPRRNAQERGGRDSVQGRSRVAVLS